MPAAVGPIIVTPEQLPDDMRALEAELAKKYGPLSQLQTRFDRRGQRFKAQATFRQCGFAVELATTTGPTAIDAAKAAIVQSLALDILFIDPRMRVNTASHLAAQTKGTFDELRTLCTNAGRMIKFSIVPAHESEGAAAAAAGADADSTAAAAEGEGGGTEKKRSAKAKWAVRSFIRDDWEAISQLLPLIEITDESANTALNANAFEILETYRAEFSSPAVVKEDFLELARHLKVLKNLDLTEMCTEDQGTRTFTVGIQVTDAVGNAYTAHSKGNRTLQGAYSNASKAVFKIESDQSPAHRPLIAQMRWQVDAMCLALYGSTAVYREERATAGGVATHGRLLVDDPVTGVGAPGGLMFRHAPGVGEEGSVPTAWGLAADGDAGSAAAKLRDGRGFSLFAGRVLAENTGQGAYRVEFNCYAAALKSLLRDHPEVAAQSKTLPFLRETELDEAIERHDSYDIAALHRGKWTPYACLGTLTASLIGSSFQSEFEEVPEGLHISTRAHLFVNDGELFARPLLSRLGKEKASAWRTACADAIRDNFPKQHAQLLANDEYAQSISQTEGMVSKHKGLPREQRAPHFSNLFSMLQSFAQEDFMWTQMQLISIQSPANGMWVGEVHVLEAGRSRCVYQSDQFATSKLARKVACYAVSMKHYPAETQIYIGLNRGDYVAGDREFLAKVLSRTYDSRKPLTHQLCALIEKNQPKLAPVTWRLEAMDATGRQRATVFSRETAPIADIAGDPLETAVSTLQRALIAACRATNTPYDTLMEEYLATTPPNVNSERDLATYLFVSFMGKLPTVSSVCVNQSWIQTLTIELEDGRRVLLHRSENNSKKEGTAQAYILGAKFSFPQLLRNMASAACDMREIAHAILARTGSHIMLDGRLVSESEMMAAAGVEGSEPVAAEATAESNGDKASGDAATSASAASSSSSSSPSSPSFSKSASSPAEEAPSGGIMPVSKAARLVNKCVAEFDIGYSIVTTLEVLGSGATRATLTRRSSGAGGEKVLFEEAGVGTGPTAAEAVHNAAVAVLENLYDTHMAEALEADEGLCDFPSATSNDGSDDPSSLSS